MELETLGRSRSEILGLLRNYLEQCITLVHCVLFHEIYMQIHTWYQLILWIYILLVCCNFMSYSTVFFITYAVINKYILCSMWLIMERFLLWVDWHDSIFYFWNNILNRNIFIFNTSSIGDQIHLSIKIHWIPTIEWCPIFAFAPKKIKLNRIRQLPKSSYTKINNQLCDVLSTEKT